MTPAARRSFPSIAGRASCGSCSPRPGPGRDRPPPPASPPFLRHGRPRLQSPGNVHPSKQALWSRFWVTRLLPRLRGCCVAHPRQPQLSNAVKGGGCLMPVIPIPRRVRSFHGPHTTCLHSACGPVRTTHLVRTKYNNFDIYLKSRWMYGFIRFLLYFSCSLFTSILWVALSLLFCLQYLSIRVFLRFQYKLSIILLLLGRRRVDFSLVNELLIYGIHVTMLLVGGLGWCFMVFVDM